MSIKHTIRNPKGNSRTDTIEVTLTPITAIVRLCRECLGHEGEPKDCTSKLCPVYPYRTGDSHNHKNLTPEQRAAIAERLAKNRT